MTEKIKIDRLLRVHQSLCYGGFKALDMTPELFAESREKLQSSSTEIDLCRRVFREDRFKKRYAGKRSAYLLKHVAERWDFDENLRRPSEPYSHYNGIYVSQGSAAAAALLEGFEVSQIGLVGPGSVVSVPRPTRVHRSPPEVANPAALCR
jgi:hypothetical protein